MIKILGCLWEAVGTERYTESDSWSIYLNQYNQQWLSKISFPTLPGDNLDLKLDVANILCKSDPTAQWGRYVEKKARRETKKL